MSDEAREDVLVLGPGRRAGATTWLAGFVAASLVAGVVVLEARRSGHPAGRAGAGTAVTSPGTVPKTPAAVTVRRVDDEYLVQVPPGDMRAVLASAACRAGCTAHTLTGVDLDRAAAGFAGLRALAGGFVTGPASSAVQESIEGRARPDALVHLVIERTRARPTGGVTTTDRPGDGFRSLRLTMVRDGWRFTAGLVVRGAVPPVDAAAAWVRSAPPPG
ncbi:MAG: hypothetical protein ABR571_01830 [Jatrophihabitans sp.]|uniref:hypothetical protein n=1 Tax=Jatrophihabitans sp. TaxID=1932789 RepID=UPI003915D534